MKSLLFAGLALAALSQSALAAAPRLDGIADRILSADWTNSASIDDDLFKAISFKAAEGQAFTLETSKLSDVLAAFGGKVQSTSAYGGPVSWLCYDSAGKRTWFIGAELGEDKAPLLTLIAEEAIGKSAPDAGCDKVADALSPVPGDKLPGLGAKLSELQKRYGGADPDDKGRVSFMSSAPLGTGDIMQAKNIYYLVSKGEVTAVAFSAASEQ